MGVERAVGLGILDPLLLGEGPLSKRPSFELSPFSTGPRETLPLPGGPTESTLSLSTLVGGVMGVASAVAVGDLGTGRGILLPPDWSEGDEEGGILRL